MKTAITALIVISVLMLSVLALSERFLSAQATISEAAGAMQEWLGERARTDLAPIGTATPPGGDYVSVTLRDAGSARLAGFNQWDVILQYTDGAGGYHVTWYPYSSKWTKTIYMDASAGIVEAVEPDILNPGEKIVVLVGVSPYVVRTGTTNLATIGAPNGICASSVFTH
jgi:hypothetical protein